MLVFRSSRTSFRQRLSRGVGFQIDQSIWSVLVERNQAAVVAGDRLKRSIHDRDSFPLSIRVVRPIGALKGFPRRGKEVYRHFQRHALHEGPGNSGVFEGMRCDLPQWPTFAPPQWPTFTPQLTSVFVGEFGHDPCARLQEGGFNARLVVGKT